MLANVAALSRRHEVSLISLGGDPVPGLRHRPIALAEDGWLRRGLELQTRVARIVDHYAFDGFHVRSPFEGLAVPSDRPIVYEVNALYSLELASRYPANAEALRALERVHVMERCLLERATRIVTPSRVTAELLEALGVARARIDVVPNAPSIPIASSVSITPSAPNPPSVPMAPSPPGRARVDAPPPRSDDLRLVYAGSLAPWQGLPELLVALGRWPHFRLTIVTEERAAAKALLALASDLGLRERVELLPAVGVDALGAVLTAHDVGVAPLLPCDRNLLQGCHPVKLLDYAAAGLPVLAPDIPVVRDVVGPEYPLYEPYSHEGVVDVLEALHAQPELRTRLGRELHARVAEEYSPDRYADRVLDVWARIEAGR